MATEEERERESGVARTHLQQHGQTQNALLFSRGSSLLLQPRRWRNCELYCMSSVFLLALTNYAQRAFNISRQSITGCESIKVCASM